MNPEYKEISYHQLMKKIEVLNELTLDEAWGIGGLLPGKSSAAKESERKRMAGEEEAERKLDISMGGPEKRQLKIDKDRKVELDTKKLTGSLTPAETTEHGGINAKITTSTTAYKKQHQSKLDDAEDNFNITITDPTSTTAQKNLARKQLEIAKAENKETTKSYKDHYSYDKKESEEDKTNIEQGKKPSILGNIGRTLADTFIGGMRTTQLGSAVASNSNTIKKYENQQKELGNTRRGSRGSASDCNSIKMNTAGLGKAKQNQILKAAGCAEIP